MASDSQDFRGRIHQATDRARGIAAEQHQGRNIARAAAQDVIDGAWIRFQEASIASGKALEFERDTLDGAVPRLSLTWTAAAPVRRLALQPANVGGHIYWEIRADFNTIGVYAPGPDSNAGVVPAMKLTPDVVDSLIMVLLDQEAWGEGRMPHFEVPGSIDTKPGPADQQQPPGWGSV